MWNVYGDVYASAFLGETLGIVSSPNLGSRLGRVTTSVSEGTTRMYTAKGGSFWCAMASVIDLPELECQALENSVATLFSQLNRGECGEVDAFALLIASTLFLLELELNVMVN